MDVVFAVVFGYKDNELKERINQSINQSIMFPVMENLPCLKPGESGTAQVVNLNRGLFPSGRAFSPFSSNLHFMRKKLQPYMNIAVDKEAEVINRFQFRDAGAEVALT